MEFVARPSRAASAVVAADARTVSAEPGAAPTLSLVFPAFDEEANLGPLIQSALSTGERLGLDFEVIVVDDGSQDGSPALLREWARREPRLRVVHHRSNTGYGAALRSGLRLARGELVFFSDADLQFDLDEIEELLTHTERFDVVAGYRSPRRDPWPRRLLAWGWGTLVRTLFDLPVRDIDCAFKVFRRDVIGAMPIASLGAFVNTEILVRARAAGFRLKQVPVSHRRRQAGRQTGANPRVIARALLELGALFRELRLGPELRRVVDPTKGAELGPRPSRRLAGEASLAPAPTPESPAEPPHRVRRLSR